MMQVILKRKQKILLIKVSNMEFVTILAQKKVRKGTCTFLLCDSKIDINIILKWVDHKHKRK